MVGFFEEEKDKFRMVYESNTIDEFIQHVKTYCDTHKAIVKCQYNGKKFRIYPTNQQLELWK